MIGSLGRQPSADKLTIYIKQQEPTESNEVESPSSMRLLSRYRSKSKDAPNDLLRTIEEVDRGSKTTVDWSSVPVMSVPKNNMTNSEREKKRYQRTMTPNTLRSKLQEKLINSFDTNELAGTIASIQIAPKDTKESRWAIFFVIQKYFTEYAWICYSIYCLFQWTYINKSTFYYTILINNPSLVTYI